MKIYVCFLNVLICRWEQRMFISNIIRGLFAYGTVPYRNTDEFLQDSNFIRTYIRISFCDKKAILFATV